MDINTVTLSGNMTRAAELRFTPAGVATAQFGLAVNRRRRDAQTHEWKEETSFFDVVAYGQLAENLCETTDRGFRVTVAGRLEHRTWQTSGGEKRSKTEVVAESVAVDLTFATAVVSKVERKTDR